MNWQVSLYVIDILLIIVGLAGLAYFVGRRSGNIKSYARLFQMVTDQHSYLKALIEASGDGILLVDMNRNVLITNAPALQFLGLSGSPEDWASRSIVDVLTHLRHDAPAAVRAAITDIRRIRRGDEPPTESEYEIKAHTIQWLNLPVMAETKPLGRLIILRDVTEAKQLKTMRDNLTDMMVHNLRNPLSIIMASLDMITLVTDNLSSKQREYLELAQARTDVMTDLVNNILDVSFLENKQMPLHCSLVAPDELVKATIQAQLPLAADKELSLTSGIPEHLQSIYADAKLLERVLENLIGNAIKFTPTGGWIEVQVRLEDRKESEAKPGYLPYLHFSVSDNGPGISSELQSRLFQKFAKGHQKESGSGLGLAFCKLVVEAHRGRIWVESELEQGTTVHFILPAQLNGQIK